MKAAFLRPSSEDQEVTPAFEKHEVALAICQPPLNNVLIGSIQVQRYGVKISATANIPGFNNINDLTECVVILLPVQTQHQAKKTNTKQ
ncbi:MAG: hypothetical protein OQL05_06705 [Gammaproteobacteria bacterium]|nr:hypothetical protein [Gammaproteobacteria bacterium]MCW8958441.1 hypothetical protein [Gammaproteobacteria bacterium]MCW8972957.1 hypothetical protein [Gammaproteobacteria bacterium]MCW8993713.1 hypothetical protein [Gammaproteobacteria bacterium]